MHPWSVTDRREPALTLSQSCRCEWPQADHVAYTEVLQCHDPVLGAVKRDLSQSAWHDNLFIYNKSSDRLSFILAHPLTTRRRRLAASRVEHANEAPSRWRTSVFSTEIHRNTMVQKSIICNITGFCSPN